MKMDEEIEYEYTETTSALKPGGIETCDPILPDGLWWVFQEKLAIGNLAVFRWKRKTLNEDAQKLREVLEKHGREWSVKELLDC
jgi:hypothetical protein